MKSKRNSIWAYAVILTSLLFSLITSRVGASIRATAQQNANHQLLQFASSGYAIGFAPDGYYAASGTHALRVQFIGANFTQPEGSQGFSSAGQIAPLEFVEYPDLWKGISLRFDAPTGGIIRSTYTLQPGADPANIRLSYNAPISVGANGSLVATYENGQFNESKPIAWQDINGQRTSVDVRFETRGRHEVGFALGMYDPAYAVTIDPVTNWNTFLGGSGDELGNSIALDGSGNIYVAGSADQAWDCSGASCTIRAYTPPAAGNAYDAFVAKLNPSGALQWVTFLGGTYDDYGNALALDNNGNIYVTGWSDAPPAGAWSCSGTPCTVTALNDVDSYVAKLDSNGNLLWNTFSGAGGAETGTGIAVDGGGTIYATGYTSGSFGTTVKRSYTALTDGYVTSLTTNGAMNWIAFLGGSGDDFANGVALDTTNSVLYVAGTSNATWSGTSTTSAYSALDDGFVVKLTTTGTVSWNAFLGGSGADQANAAGLDSSGNVYIAGTSSATWGSSPVQTYTGGTDGFAAQLSPAGALNWNTFQGSATVDSNTSIFVDALNDVFVLGTSDAAWGTPVQGYNAGNDTFAAKLDTSGNLSMSAFIGGSMNDNSGAIVVDASGNAFVIGQSNDTWGTTPIRPYTASPANNFEAFVAKVDIIPPTALSFARSTPSTSPTNADSLTFRATFSEGVTGVGTADFTVNGATTATVSAVTPISASVYDVTVSGGDLASFNGVVGLDFAALADIVDLSGNSFVVAEPGTDETYTVDNVNPSVTVEQASGQLDPTNDIAIDFTVTFDEPINVASFISSDVTLGGTIAGTSPIVTEIAPNDGTTFNIAVSGMSGTGTVTAAIGASKVQDPAGNNNNASSSTDNLVTYDGVAPIATSFALQAPAASPTNADSLTFRATFDEAVTGVDTADFAVNSTTTANVSNVTSVSTSVYDVTVSGGNLASFNGTVNLDFAASPTIADSVGNAFVAAEPTTDQTYTVDNTAPTATSFALQTPSTSPTNADSLVFRATFDEAVTGVDTTDFAVNGTTTASVSNVTPHSTTVYDVTVSGGDLISFEGVVGLDFAASPVISDIAGNAFVAAEPTTDETYTLDNTAPNITSFVRQTPSTSPTNADSLVFRATFDEAVTGVDATDFAVNGTTTASVSNVTPVSASVYDVTVSGGDLATFDGVVGLDFAASPVITDLAGNAFSAVEPATDETYTVDNTAPTAISFVLQTPATSPTNADSLTFRATFDEAVTGVDTTDFAVNGTTTASVSNVTSVSASVYDVTVSGGDLASFDGIVGLDFAASLVISDPAGNAFGGAEPTTDETYAVDNTTPTAISFVLQTPATSPANADSLTFRATFDEAVTGVDTTDFAVNGTTTASVSNVTSVSASVYDVTVSGGDLASFEGIVGLDFAASPVISDPAGNTFGGAEPTTDETYTVDNTAPDASIDSPTPTDPTTSTTASFNFSSTDGTATFECDLDSGGFTACTSPQDYTGLTDGSHTFSVHSIDPAGNTSLDATFTWIVDTAPPSVVSSVRVDANPTSKKVVSFTVTFSESVTGVDTTDFSLKKTGTISGFSVTGVSGSGAVYIVTINTGNNNGTLQLNVLNDGTIVDVANNPLTAGYTAGQVYTVKKVLNVRSQGGNDGWVLESGENTNKGQASNRFATTLRLGDDAARKQYRSILSFVTKGLPDNAVITSVLLKVKRQGITGGGNPVTIFQGFMADIRRGFFGSSVGLQSTDFQASARFGYKSYGPYKPAPRLSWYSINLTAGKAFINKLASNGGVTQIRLRFKLDDNNDSLANYLSLYSGNAPLASRPQLIIRYYVP